MLQTHTIVIFLSSHTWSDANLCQPGKQWNEALWGRSSDRAAGQCCRSTWTDGSAATGSLRILLVLWKERSFHLSPLSAGRSNLSNSHHHVACIHSAVKSRTGSHSQCSIYWSCLWGIWKTLTWATFWDSGGIFSSSFSWYIFLCNSHNPYCFVVCSLCRQDWLNASASMWLPWMAIRID